MWAISLYKRRVLTYLISLSGKNVDQLDVDQNLKRCFPPLHFCLLFEITIHLSLISHVDSLSSHLMGTKVQRGESQFLFLPGGYRTAAHCVWLLNCRGVWSAVICQSHVHNHLPDRRLGATGPVSLWFSSYQMVASLLIAKPVLAFPEAVRELSVRCTFCTF